MGLSGRCAERGAVNKGGREHTRPTLLLLLSFLFLFLKPQFSCKPGSCLKEVQTLGRGWRSSQAPSQETNAPSGGKDPEDGAEEPRRDGLCSREADKEETEGWQKRVPGQMERVESKVQHLGARGGHPRPKTHQ